MHTRKIYSNGQPRRGPAPGRKASLRRKTPKSYAAITARVQGGKKKARGK